MNEYVEITTEITVVPHGKEIFSEWATKFQLVDDGAGEFIEIEQDQDRVGIDPNEWPILRKIINKMVKQCK